MSQGKEFLDRISPFTIILTVVILMVIGLGLSPLLNIANKPAPRQGRNLTIQFNWWGASPRVIEQEVTSKIEGIVAAVRGVKNITSTSGLGNGQINITLKEDVNVSAVRFEISSLLRQIHKKLPEKVSYPSLSGGDIQNSNSNKPTTMNLLNYRINGDMDGERIKEYIEQNVAPALHAIEGVKHVGVSGGVSKYMEIAYDPLVLMNYGLNSSVIEDGIRTFMGKKDIIGDILHCTPDGGNERITLHLSTSGFTGQIGEIPLTTIGDKIIYLNDLASYEYKEREPGSYYRVNGLNTINMNITVDANANLIRLSEELREKIDELKSSLREGIYLTLTHDAALSLETELQKLIKRTALCLVILLLFVWLVSRSGRYLYIIFITLVANVLISIIAYYLLDIQLHTFSLSGIAVSFGIIIDSSIVMIDHYSYYHNRKAFLAILAALVTTIGSLIIVFFMPEYIRRDLYDFSRIIIVNLTVALFVSLFFVPAIVTMVNYRRKRNIIKIATGRRMMKWNRFYSAYITFTQRRKWIYILILLLAFGIPFYALPSKWPQAGPKGRMSVEKETEKWYINLYNTTIGSKFYQSRLHGPLSTYTGGTMRLFSKSLGGQTFSKEEREVVLHIRGQMPLGGKAIELNAKVKEIEKFLAPYKEIKRFETTINGGGATIKVEFDKEHQKNSFPFYLENMVIGQLINLGGADWSTSGVSERGFSNSLNLGHRNYRLELYGYNYNRLHKYAQELQDYMSRNGRVTDIIIENAGRTKAVEELHMLFDKQNLTRYQFNPHAGYNHLKEILTTRSLGHFSSKYINTQLELRSTQYENFDLWNIGNRYLPVAERNMLFNYLGKIEKREAKNSIPKVNQEYMLTVAFNFLGNWDLASKYINSSIEHFNEVMPIGYRIKRNEYGWYEDTGTQYWLLLLIVIIIFFMCAILFESLRLPLTIIMLIPVSFIGTFLTFYFTGIPFGTGGFASLVLLCGLVVNAGIYLINEYNYLQTYRSIGNSKALIRLYVKAYNHKIIPIFLTIISTVLGLIPFLVEGKADAFWFAFAVGTSGGLMFSITALVFVMPIFMPLSSRRNKINSNKKYQQNNEKQILQNN